MPWEECTFPHPFLDYRDSQLLHLIILRSLSLSRMSHTYLFYVITRLNFKGCVQLVYYPAIVGWQNNVMTLMLGTTTD